MSTITVVRRKNEVAIAADSQTSAGYYRAEGANYVVNHHKIFQVGDSFLALTGPSMAKIALKKHFGGLEETPLLNSIEAIYLTWLELHQALKEEYFLRPNDDGDDSFESTHIYLSLQSNRYLWSSPPPQCAGIFQVFCFWKR